MPSSCTNEQFLIILTWQKIATQSPLFMICCLTLQCIQLAEWRIVSAIAQETWNIYFTHNICTCFRSTFSPRLLTFMWILPRCGRNTNRALRGRSVFTLRNKWLSQRNTLSWISWDEVSSESVLSTRLLTSKLITKSIDPILAMLRKDRWWKSSTWCISSALGLTASQPYDSMHATFQLHKISG